MIFSSRGVLQHATRPILLDDPAHYRQIAPAFEVCKESAGKRHLMYVGISRGRAKKANRLATVMSARLNDLPPDSGGCVLSSQSSSDSKIERSLPQRPV